MKRYKVNDHYLSELELEEILPNLRVIDGTCYQLLAIHSKSDLGKLVYPRIGELRKFGPYNDLKDKIKKLEWEKLDLVVKIDKLESRIEQMNGEN